MKNLTRIFLLLSVFAIGLSSCSKEKAFTRRLYAKNGKWKNTIYRVTYYNYGVKEYEVSYKDAGDIRFEKNKSYFQTVSVNGEYNVFYGKWSYAGNDITLTTNDGFVSKWAVLEGAKNRIHLEYVNIQGEQKIVYTLTYEKIK